MILPSQGSIHRKTREVGRLVKEVSQSLEASLESFKVAVSQRRFEPTRLQDNYKKICEDIDEAVARNCKRLVFPELAIPGQDQR